MYDIDHVLNNPLAVHYYDGYVMVIGSDRSGDLLEVGINNDKNVFHAMPARKAGFSWQAIGDVLGMTRQGANKRFSVA